jgi:hypothetical protein
MIRPCDVCRHLDGDATPKPVTYCPACDAYLCAPCRQDPARRARAAIAVHGWLGALWRALGIAA